MKSGHLQVRPSTVVQTEPRSNDDEFYFTIAVEFDNCILIRSIARRHEEAQETRF